MEKPIVSIIIPIYNCEQYIEACMQSIFQQSTKNIEILMIDDGSTDHSIEICDNYAKIDTRVTVIHESNGGPALARNVGIKRSQGKWLMFMDADDTLKPTIIEELLSATNENIDIAICCCDVLVKNQIYEEHFFRENRLFIGDSGKKDLYLQLMDLSYGQSGMAYTAVGVPWGKLYRKTFIEKYDLSFPTELKRLEDNIFNMYAFHMARGIYYINRPLYIYRYDHVQTVYQTNSQLIIDTFVQFLKKRERCLKDISISEDEDICKCANHERLIYLIRTLNYGVFYPGNNKSLREQKKDAKDVVEKECFRSLFSLTKLNDLQNLQEKIAFILLKREYFTFFYLSIVIERMFRSLHT